MPVEVILPKVDMDMASGIIAHWHVNEGDAVKKGMPLFDIETDKAAMEVECPADGVIFNITAQKGAVIPVGQAVALIYQAGEGPTSTVVPSRPVLPGEMETRPDAVSPHILPVQAASGQLLATPLARRMARENKIDLKAVKGSGPRGRIVAADLPVQLASQALEDLAYMGLTAATLFPGLDGVCRMMRHKMSFTPRSVKAPGHPAGASDQRIAEPDPSQHSDGSHPDSTGWNHGYANHGERFGWLRGGASG